MSKSYRHRQDFNDKHPFTETRRILHDLGRDDIIPDRIVDPRTDNRVFHPERTRNVLPVDRTLKGIAISNRRTRDNVRSKRVDFRRSVGPNDYVDFTNPSHWVEHPRKALVCARRAIRRSVILSKLLSHGRGGRGGGRMRQKKYNNDSLIHCRR